MEKMFNKVQMFNALASLVESNASTVVIGENTIPTADIVTFLTNESALVTRRNTRKSGPSKEKLEKDEALKTAILEVLGSAEGEGMTATQIANAVGSSSQKVTYLMKSFTEDEVSRKKVKKSYVYKIA